MRLSAYLIVLGALTAAPSAASAAESVTLCDRLTADAHNPKRTAPGVHIFDMDPNVAIPACKAAVEAEPGSARLQDQYGRALYRGRNWAEGELWIRKAADQGDAAAQSDLAYVLWDKDPTEAVRLTQLAVAQGLAVAKGDLGWDYAHGLVVPRDYDKALALFREAIAEGDEYAMCHLGEMYEYGWGVPKDDAEAVKWYRAAAERRYRGGFYHLALMLRDGRGVARDEDQAERLLEKAAAQELKEAATALAKLRANRAEARP